jgi:UDP-N-acetylmuramate dehydrogenase
MKPSTSFSLQPYNSFALACTTTEFIEINQLADLGQLTQLNTPFYILGEGSNTLFLEQQAPTIIKMNLKGITLSETKDTYIVKVAAGEHWHALVCYCLERDINGLENLALIPGSVGAAPVQNIGAYGVEFADFCYSVNYYDFASKQIIELKKAQCQFAYRESIFKQQYKNKGIITGVTLHLPKIWQPKVSYQGLNELAKPLTAQAIFKQVIAMRSAKLPDPKKIANAGSFFKNPVVSKDQYQQLAQQFEQVPHYPQNDGNIKLAAGWLIEQAGLKGYKQGSVGVHKNQALVLVNYGGGTGSDVSQLALYVQQKVRQKFNVNIVPEVRLISHNGEIDFTQLTSLAKK